MFVGHGRAGLVAKRWVPQAPLWLQMFAMGVSGWAIYFIFAAVAAGLERRELARV